MRRRRGGGPDGARVGRVGRLDVELGVVGRELLLRLSPTLFELGVVEGLTVPKLRGSFEGHAQLRLARPDALQVWITPRCLRHRGWRLRQEAHPRCTDDEHRTDERPPLNGFSSYGTSM